MSPAPLLLAASHGTDDENGRAAVASLVAAIAAELPDVPVSASFVDVQQPDVPSALDALEPGRDAVIVPLLLSAGYHVRTDLARDARDAAGRTVTVAGALGPDERLARLLARRLAEAGLGPDDIVVLGAAGSTDPRAVDDCRVAADQLAALIGRPVTVGFISAAHPRLPDAVAAARVPGRRLVVATYLLAPGYFARLAREAGGDIVTSPLLAAGTPVPPELVAVAVDRYLALSAARHIHEPHAEENR